MQRRRLFSCFLTLCLLWAGLAGQAFAAPAPLLWKVSGQGATVYLLGSFHMLAEQDYPLSADVDVAFDDAESLLFEIDPAEFRAPETLLKLQQAGVATAGSGLGRTLPPASLERLRPLLDSAGIPRELAERLEPWALALQLLTAMARGAGLRADLGMDAHLMQRAAVAGKPVAGLESVDEQLAALRAGAGAEQVRELQELIDAPRQALDELLALHGAWKQGDVASLDGHWRARMQAESPQGYRVMNVQRNQAWLPRLEQRLARPGDEDVLAVVGALHLLGSDGLVQQLQARGYAVERICTACAPD